MCALLWAHMKTSEVTKYDSQRGALKLKPAARYLDLWVIAVRRLISRGLLKPNRSTRHLILPVRELDRFLAEGQQ